MKNSYLVGKARTISPTLAVHQGTLSPPDIGRESGLKKARHIWWNLAPAQLIERTLLSGEGRLPTGAPLPLKPAASPAEVPRPLQCPRWHHRPRGLVGDINQPLSSEHADLSPGPHGLPRRQRPLRSEPLRGATNHRRSGGPRGEGVVQPVCLAIAAPAPECGGSGPFQPEGTSSAPWASRRILPPRNAQSPTSPSSTSPTAAS